MYKKVDPKENFPALEKKILNFWNKKRIFQKSVEGRSKEKTFSFYDGPPFATGNPHYGHLLPGTIKDVIPRYKTMQGFRVERVWGWDTHGLPIENIVEQELDFKSRVQIEEFGIDKFNEKCKEKVLEYADEWKKIIGRTGRWVDMDNAYLTMDFAYMESVWWAFKRLWDKKLIEKGHKVMPYCSRCATGLSTFEVGMPGTYKDKRDKAITVKFESIDESGTYFLAWTTTPWTLPGNLALSVGEKIDYIKVRKDKKNYILAEKRYKFYESEIGGEIIDHIKGSSLVGKKYKPVMNYYKKPKKAFEIIAGDFVSTEDGTGIVHTAPAFGVDDYETAKKAGIDFFMPVNDLGEFSVEVSEYSGNSVVHFETNEKIIKDLGTSVLKIEEITHSYPHCWRCETPLIYKAIDSYFVKVSKFKKRLIELNKNINWVPKYVGKGRFGNLLKTAPDWNISRNRFWGTPLPVWICEKCSEIEVFGETVKLEEKSGEKIKDLHLHYLRKVEVPCDCGGKKRLSGEVLDCWFESGAMPYGSIHYPFENKERFDRDFPSDFIAESIDQTRGWFNSLLLLSTGLFDNVAYNNVVVSGLILAENGQKMSKRLKNYPEVSLILDKYGADPLRFYLMSSAAVKAGDLNFSEKGVDDILKKVILTLWNSYSFFVTYASLDKFEPTGKLSGKNILDKWIISETNNLIKSVTENMDNYDLTNSTRKLYDFIDNLSNWYIRRSRKRFWKSENDTDKSSAYETLYYVLVNYIKLLAPFMPFVTEEIYQNLKNNNDPQSIHLCDWPKYKNILIDLKLEEKMSLVRKVIEIGLAKRAEASIKVRQPLLSLKIKLSNKIDNNLLEIISEEVNVKRVLVLKSDKLEVLLDTKITPELEQEGLAREFVRQVQSMRKRANFNVEDRIIIYYQTNDTKLKQTIKNFEDSSYSIKKETLASDIITNKLKGEYQENIKINQAEIAIGLIRISK